MTLIDGDRIITAQLYDDEHEEFKEEKMSIIDYVNIYTTEGVTIADDVLDKIKAKIEEYKSTIDNAISEDELKIEGMKEAYADCLKIIDKYRAESEEVIFNNLCSSCTNIGCEFQSGIVRTECAFYMPPHIEPDNCGNYVVMQPVKPQEPCGDAIDRQAAIEAFQMFREYESNRSNKEWVDRIETVLNQLPPVTPQPKTGHWISLDDFRGKYNERGFKCSECDEHSSFEENFCPGCGAKMVEPTGQDR